MKSTAVHRRSLVVAVLAALAVGAGGAAAPVGVAATAPTEERTAQTTILAGGAIQPGTVNRTSPRVTAEYRATLDLAYGTRKLSVDSTATVTNTSGGPIDRVELNTIAGPLGSMTLRGAWVDGVARTPKRIDQTVVVPLGGILPAGSTATVRVRYGATLRTSLSGSSWLFTKANGIADLYRWLPWVSKATPFARPNHGDPFVTAVSPYVRVTIRTDRKLVIAATG